MRKEKKKPLRKLTFLVEYVEEQDYGIWVAKCKEDKRIYFEDITIRGLMETVGELVDKYYYLEDDEPNA